MIWGQTEVPGWFYSKQFDYYQRTNGRVVCYVQRQLFGRCLVQLYTRGFMDICDLEYRVEDGNPLPLFEIGEQWLEEFQEGDVQKIHVHPYSPRNPKGHWAEPR